MLANMVTYVLILAAIGLQTGIILYNYQIDCAKAVDIDDLLGRVEALEKRDNERENEHQLCKQQVDDMNTHLVVIVNENRQLKLDIDKLNNRINKIESESIELKNELINIRTEDTDHHGMNEKEEKVVKKEDKHGKNGSGFHDIPEAHNISIGMTDDQHSIPSNVRDTREVSGIQPIQRAENEFGVAFYVRLSNHLLHAGSNQNIVFDQTYTNVGNAYNVHAGDFRAPVAGTYVFATSLTAYGTHTTNCFFARNGVNVGNIYVNGKESPNKSSSMTIVLHLDAGDDVAIRNINPDEALHTYSSFAGYLLQQD